MVRRVVEMGTLKQFALTLAPNSPLRSILLTEPDSLSTEAFLERMSTWLRLATIEGEKA